MEMDEKMAKRAVILYSIHASRLKTGSTAPGEHEHKNRILRHLKRSLANHLNQSKENCYHVLHMKHPNFPCHSSQPITTKKDL